MRVELKGTSVELAGINAAIANTIFADQLHGFAQIDSTNVYAMQQGRSGAPHGSVYVADEQLAGRGRGDHRWHSAAGEGLYVSVLLRPQWSPSQLIWLPLIAGLALHRAIQSSTALDADLRWPNDMLLHGRKCAGILVEAQTDSLQQSFAVVGIGVNLRQREFPPDLATPATSLELETGREILRESLFLAVLQSLHAELEAVNTAVAAAAYFASIPARMEQISTWIRGKRVRVHGPQEFCGVTAGLDGDGFLRVQTEQGLQRVLTGGLREATSAICTEGRNLRLEF